MNKCKMAVVGAIVMLGMQSAASSASGELAIIVSAENQVNAITVDEVANIFLGKSRNLPDGTRAIPIDQFEGESPRTEFYRKVVQKNQAQLNSYWSRLIFSGKGQPPFAVTSDSEVLEFVSANPNMIGYVNLSALEQGADISGVKVLLTIR